MNGQKQENIDGIASIAQGGVPILPIKVDGKTAIDGYTLINVCKGKNSRSDGNNGPIVIARRDGELVYLLISSEYLESLEKDLGLTTCLKCVQEKLRREQEYAQEEPWRKQEELNYPFVTDYFH